MSGCRRCREETDKADGHVISVKEDPRGVCMGKRGARERRKRRRKRTTAKKRRIIERCVTMIHKRRRREREKKTDDEVTDKYES